MNSKRFNLGMMIITGLLGFGILGAVFGANSLLKQQSDKLSDLKLKSQVLTQEQVSLAKAKKDIKKYAELEREAKIIVPQDKDQAEVVREIVKIAESTGVSVSSIIFPASTLGSTKIGATTTTGTSNATTPSPNSAPVTQTQVVTGLKGVYSLPITVQALASPVSYTNFISFLHKLEQNRRTSQVNGVSIQPLVTNPSQVNFTLIINAYIKP